MAVFEDPFPPICMQYSVNENIAFAATNLSINESQVCIKESEYKIVQLIKISLHVMIHGG